MRGKRHPRRKAAVCAGLIPAHAGKTIYRDFHYLGRWAHPRACGENSQPVEGIQCLPGSSPRMRGKRKSHASTGPPGGLIPAHAGKTHSPLTTSYMLTAHPRACGENYRPDAEIVPMLGSSPRMRGKLSARCRDRANVGLIPAHAGKTSSRRVEHRGEWAHPRACGENRLPLIQALAPHGSSPRMRGKRRDV